MRRCVHITTTLLTRNLNMVAGLNGRYLKCRRIASAIAYVFNVHAIAVGVVASICVFLCHHFNFSYQLEFAFVSLGITFPLTFAIAQQFTRRERALTVLGELKASGATLYWLHRDWAQGTGRFPESLGDDSHAWAREVSNVLLDFLDSVQRFITARGTLTKLLSWPVASIFVRCIVA